jgi:hypothetical protein
MFPTLKMHIAESGLDYKSPVALFRLLNVNQVTRWDEFFSLDIPQAVLRPPWRPHTSPLSYRTHLTLRLRENKKLEFLLLKHNLRIFALPSSFGNFITPERNNAKANNSRPIYVGTDLR